MSARGRQLPSRGRRLAYSALAVGLGLGTVELSAAVAERTVLAREQPLPSPGAPQLPVVEGHSAIPLAADGRKGWGLARGGSARVNELGLRGADLAEPVGDEVRLLTLGDSSIYGDGVDEGQVFEQVAAAALSRSWGRTVRGVNGGVPGYDTGQSLGLLARVGEAVQPDLVVVANLWSDVFAGEHHKRAQGPGLEDWTTPLRAFATWRVTRTLLAPWLASRRVGFAVDPSRIGSLSEEGGTRTSLQAYVAGLNALADRSEELGAQVVFVVLPAPLDFDEVPPPEAVAAFRGAMAAVAEQRGALLLDGPARFPADGGSPGEFQDQVHPAASGHARVGRLLAGLLEPHPPPPRQRARVPRLRVDDLLAAEAVEAGDRVILELDAGTERDVLLEAVRVLTEERGLTVRLAPAGQPAVGGPVSLDEPEPPLLAVALRGATLDAWLETRGPASGKHLGPAPACMEAKGRKADAGGMSGRAPWRDLGVVPQTRVELLPEHGGDALLALLPLLPASSTSLTVIGPFWPPANT